jgi:hypothetical protein
MLLTREWIARRYLHDRQAWLGWLVKLRHPGGVMSFHAWRKTQAHAGMANEFSKVRLQDANRALRHIVEAMNASM